MTTVAPVISSSTSTTTTTTSTLAPTTTTTTSTTTVETLIVDIDSLTTFATDVQKSTENPPTLNLDLSKPVFLRYQPRSDSQFQTLPPLSSVALGCDCIISLGPTLSSRHCRHFRLLP